MAFCEVTNKNISDLTFLVAYKVRKNPEVLKSFKDFANSMVSELTTRGADLEKALAIVSYLPQAVNDFTSDVDNRALLRKAKVSMDAISDVEDSFLEYSALTKYLGIKNEVQPIVLVHEPQLAAQKKINDHILATKVEFNGNQRLINGKAYETRVTSVAKVGYQDDSSEDAPSDSPALKHGNTVDAIAKAVFDDITPKASDFKDLIDQSAFETLVGQLKAIKQKMHEDGFIFKTGVTVYNAKLGISGEIDLVAISSKGEVSILDFKTAGQRFNEAYLKRNTLRFTSDAVEKQVGMLSKWEQYGTQGYIYGKMLSDQLGIPVSHTIGIIGINIVYNNTLPAAESKIEKTAETTQIRIPDSTIRSEFKGKNLQEILDIYKDLQTKSLGQVTEIKPTKTRQKLDLPRREELDRIASIQDIAATEPQLQEEVNWFLGNPVARGTLLTLDNVVNAGVLGRFTLDGIRIFKNATAGTVYHEGWHRFSQVFMTPSQKDALYKSVQDDNISFKTRDGRKLSTKDAAFLDVEEFLAEEFAKFGLNPEAYAYPKTNPAPKNLFQRIWDFLKRYFGSNPRPIELFQKLYKGQINTYSPSVNNAYWGKLNSQVTNSKGEEIVSNERFPLYVEAVEYLIAKNLDDAKKSMTAFKQSKVLQGKVMNNVFLSLTEKYNDENTPDDQASEIFNILQNKFEFTRAYLKSTSLDTLKNFSVDEDIFTLEANELLALDELRENYEEGEDIDEKDDDSKPDRFDRRGDEDSALTVADDAITDFFRTFPKIKAVNPDGTYEYHMSELGFPVNHSYHDAFYRAKRMLSGAFRLDDMLSRMTDPNNQRLFPELKLIYNRLVPFLDNSQEKNPIRMMQNVMFVQAFYHVMTLPEVPNMQLTINTLPITRPYRTFKPLMVSYRRAARSLGLKIIETWSKNFKDKRGKDPVSFYNFDTRGKDLSKEPIYMTESGKIYLNQYADFATLFPQNQLTGVRDFYEVLGIDFNPKVWQDPDAVRELVENKFIIQKNIAIVKNGRNLDLLTILDEQLQKRGVDTAAYTTPQDYFSALTQQEMDAVASTYFIDSPFTFFKERKVYEYLSSYQGKTRTVSESTDALNFKFEELAEIEEKFGDRVSSGAYRIEDKTKYPYYIPNQLLIVTNLLNKVKNYGDFSNELYLKHLDPTINKWMKRSYFYKMMFDSDGNRKLDPQGKPVHILAEDIASHRTVSDTGIVEKHPGSLTTDEKFVMDLMTMFKAGALEIPRAETSSSIFSIRLSSYGNFKDGNRFLPIAPSEALGYGNSLPESFHLIVKDYFAAEIEKRQWYMQHEPDSKFAKIFNVFQGILPEELRNKIEDNLSKTPEEIYAMDGILTEFRDAVQDHFGKEIDKILPRFKDKSVGLSDNIKAVLRDTVKAKSNQNLDFLAKAFVLNHFILSQEFYSLYFGDLYHYKNPFKRGKFVTNTGTAYFIDEARNQMLNSINGESLHSIFTGKSAADKDFTKLKTGIIEDVEMQSAYTAGENLLLNDILNVRKAMGTLSPSDPNYNKTVDKIRRKLKSYDKINIADGQGIIGLDFYRNFSIMTKIWSPEKEEEYNRQKAILRNHFNLYKETGDELAFAKARDKQLIDKLPNKSKPTFFNPLKISYTGPQAKDGPLRPVFDKFSVRTITPETAIGRRDEAMLLKMLESDIDYLKFSSGTKVYKDNSFNWFKKLGEGQYDLNDFSTEEITSNELYSAYLKHQLSTEGRKEENILGSQFRKIFFGVDNPALYNNFRGLESEFKDTIDKLLEIEEADLFSLLGIEKKGNDYQIKDSAKFLKLLSEESVKRGIAINNIDYIQYNAITKTATNPLDYAFNRQQIQDLLAGLIDDRLRRLKVNGSSLIQVSSAGFENNTKFTNATKEDLRKYGTTGLHYYHITYDKNGKPLTTSTMGVKVALLGQHRNLLNLPAPEAMGVSDYNNKITGLLEDGTIAKGKESSYSSGKIGTLERLNEAIREHPEWKQKYMNELTLIGYRIPTQNNNFIDHMEIMEFLPASAGAIIVPPIELIIKSGSDFDIDKMNVILPVIGSQGQLVKAPKETLEEINKAIEGLTYSEKDARQARKEVSNLIEKGNFTLESAMSLQRKIRFTMLDLAMKSGANDLIDTIMTNIRNHENTVIPESESEENAFPEQVVDAKEPNGIDLFQATLDFAKVDAEIGVILRSLEVLTDVEAKKTRRDLELFERKTQYKNAITNRMVDILKKTMSDPSYFEPLVTPSSAEEIEEMTNQLMAAQSDMDEETYNQALKDSDGKLFDNTKTPTQNSSYAANTEAFENLVSKIKDLGTFAINRTFAEVFNFVKFSLAQNYTNDKGENATIHTPLMPLEDRSKKVKNGRVDMYGNDIEGNPIKDAFDKFITLTVDLAASPAYPKMDINLQNKKHAVYLLHQGNTVKSVLFFLNQPVLKELYRYFNQRKKDVVGYTIKHAITEMTLARKILQNPEKENSSRRKYEPIERKWVEFDEEKADETGERGEWVTYAKKANTYLTRPYWDLGSQNVTDADYFSIEQMDQAIRDTSTKGDFQDKVLAYFASMIIEADEFSRVQFSNNVDTTKYSTITAIMKNQKARRELRTRTTIFDHHQLDQIEKESMIAPFDYTAKAYQIQKTLFPKLYTGKTLKIFSDLVNDVFGAKNVQIERISKIVENDFIEFVYKNYGTYNGKNLSEHFESQLLNTDGAMDHKFFTYKFIDLKNKYPELSDIPFVDALAENVYFPPTNPVKNSYQDMDNVEIHNLFLLRNPDNPTSQKNLFTTNWRNLINFNPEKLGLKNDYSPEQMQEIADFFHELVYFSLYQSGLTNTGNGFSDLIPYEHWATFIQKAFDAWDSNNKLNAALEGEMLRVFEVRFKQMNPNMNWQTKYILLNSWDEEGKQDRAELPFYKNYYRGKDYKVTDNDLNIVRDHRFFTSEQLEDDVFGAISKPAEAHAGPKLETGRYVRYQGEIYIVTKALKQAQIWQIYDPNKEGPKAKLSVHEKNLEPLADKGSVITLGAKSYIVTAKEKIIDLDTNRVVPWPRNSSMRIQVIQAAKDQNDTPNDNITPKNDAC